MKKRNVLVVIYVLCTMVVRGQIVPLDVGDRVPDVVIRNVFNSDKNEISLRDLNGKLVILDFWANYCHGCVKAIPRMDSLQKEYGDKIAIIVVTFQGAEGTKAFWKKNKLTQRSQLPVATNDTTLIKYFPFQTIPHEVWIGPDGKVKAITSEEYVVRENLEMILAGKNVDWPMKLEIKDFDYAKSLSKSVNGGAGRLRYYSAFTGPLTGVRSFKAIQIENGGLTKRMIAINYTIPQLVVLGAGFLKWGHESLRLRFSVRDSSRFYYSKSMGPRLKWDQDNIFCYEAVYPSSYSDDKIVGYFYSDLSRYLALDAELEEVQTECLVLVKVKEGVIPNAVPVGKSARLRNTKQLCNSIAYSFKIPVEDATCGVSKLAIDENEMKDENRLRIALANWGYDILRTTKPINMIVVDDMEFPMK